MSYRLYPLAWAASVSTTAKIVLLKLVDHASDDGTNVRPGVKAICSACGLSERAVRSALASLRSAGIIVKVGEADPATKRPREYRIALDQLKAAAVEVDGCTYCTPAANAPLHQMPRPLQQVPQTPAAGAPKSILEPFSEPKNAAEAAPGGAVEAFATRNGDRLDLQVETAAATLLTGIHADAAPIDRKKQLYDFGRSVLGANSGGQVTNLVKHHGNDLDAVDRTLRLASTKSDPREYVGAILRGNTDARHEDVVSQIDDAYRRWGVQ